MGTAATTSNTTDAAGEKHIPLYEVRENTVYVNVGEVGHPMQEGHSIEWVSIQTKHGGQWRRLKPGKEPKACFALCEGDEVEAVYAYCNLHGLWKARPDKQAQNMPSHQGQNYHA